MAPHRNPTIAPTPSARRSPSPSPERGTAVAYRTLVCVMALLAALLLAGGGEPECPSCAGGPCGGPGCAAPLAADGGRLPDGGRVPVGPPLPCDPPTRGDLVLNELLADPSGADINRDGVPDPYGDEFVEIISLAETAVSLEGISLWVSGRRRTGLPHACLPAGGALVMFGGGAAAPTLASLTTVADGPFRLSNAGSTVQMVDAAGDILDSVTYGPEADGPRSLTRVPDGTGVWDLHPPLAKDDASPPAPVLHSAGRCVNGQPFPDCLARVADPRPGPIAVVPTAPAEPAPTTPPDDAEPPPPGCPPVTGPELLLNELLADPGTLDANGDGNPSWLEDEFIELLLRAAGARDLTGVEVRVNGALRTMLPPGCWNPGTAFVVFSGGLPGLALGPAVQVLVADKSLRLTNTGGVLAFQRGGEVLYSLAYGPEAGHDESLTRWPDLVGPFVPHGLAVPGSAASPGTCADGRPLATGCRLTTDGNVPERPPKATPGGAESHAGRHRARAVWGATTARAGPRWQRVPAAPTRGAGTP